MSRNISKEKREKLVEKIKAIKTYIASCEQDENTSNLLSYIAEIEKDIKVKKYGLVFEEHHEEIDETLENAVPILVEEQDLFINNNGDMNFLIEGDNLASLTLLEKTHKGKIDFIYIDPPYNTGKEDFIYNDRYVDDEDSFRHSKWSSFMKKRLVKAQQLLADDGVIFISIDDNEYAPLKLLCDDIFGVHNCLSIHHIQVRYANKSLNEKKAFQECIEYVLIYAKDISKFDPNRPKKDYSLDSFKFKIVEKVNVEQITIGDRIVEVFKKGEWDIETVEPGIDNLKETWVTGSIYSGTGHGKMYQKVVEPRLDIDGYQCLYKIYGLGEDGLGYRYFTGPQKVTATKGKMFTGVPLEKREALEKGKAIKYGVISNFYDFSPDFGNIRHEGGVGFNSGKKPTKMLKQFLNYHKRKDITVLDFFAGSASTGHAVIALNNEDGGNRKFIMCTSPEKDICRTIAYQRLKNVIEENNKTSLKYFKVEYLPIKEKFYYEYADELLKHVKELVELENSINFNGNSNIAIILTEEELDSFSENIEKHPECQIIYLGHDVLMTSIQAKLLNDKKIKINVIPDYYYRELEN